MRFWQALVPFGPGAFSFSGLAMETDMTIELDLYGILPEWAVYDGLSAKGAGFESGAAPVLDTKAEAPGDPFLDMQAMLLEMTKELRERFQRFQSQKVLAERDADDAGDEAARKLAQTDAKAAIEAVSLIVRTLEKIDSLQRTLIAGRTEAEAGGEDDEARANLAWLAVLGVVHRGDPATVWPGGQAGDLGAGFKARVGILQRHGQRGSLGIHLAVIAVGMRVPRGSALGEPFADIDAKRQRRRMNALLFQATANVRDRRLIGHGRIRIGLRVRRLGRIIAKLATHLI